MMGGPTVHVVQLYQGTMMGGPCRSLYQGTMMGGPTVHVVQLYQGGPCRSLYQGTMMGGPTPCLMIVYIPCKSLYAMIGPETIAIV